MRTWSGELTEPEEAPAERECWAPELDRRTEDRSLCKRKVSVVSGKQTHPGVVEGWSPGGLFVRTPAQLAPGTSLLIRVAEPPLLLEARVAYSEAVARSLDGLNWRGMGLRVATLPTSLVRALEDVPEA